MGVALGGGAARIPLKLSIHSKFQLNLKTSPSIHPTLPIYKALPLDEIEKRFGKSIGWGSCTKKLSRVWLAVEICMPDEFISLNCDWRAEPVPLLTLGKHVGKNDNLTQ